MARGASGRWRLVSSGVETLQPGESLNVLNTGRAGDNVTVYRFETTNSVDAATPMLKASTGGANCSNIGVYVKKVAGAPTVLGFKQGNDMVVRARVEQVTEHADGTVSFVAEVPETTVAGTGWSFPPTLQLGKGWSFPPTKQ